MIIVFRLFLIGLLCSLFACGGGGSGSSSSERDSPVATSISVEPASWTSERRGQRQQFTATVIDQYGEPMAGTPVTWESRDVDSATVDSVGMATTLEAGRTTTIAARAEGLTGTADIATGSVVPSDFGEMYTLWFARSWTDAVMLVDGMLRFDNLYLDYPGPADSRDVASPWEFGEVEKYQWANRNRIGLLSDMHNGLGTFRVIDRHSEWTVLALGNARDFVLEGERIAVLLEDGQLRVKDGIHGTWSTLVNSGAAEVRLLGERIAVLEESGLLRVKDGIFGAWREIASAGIRDFQLASIHIGMLYDSGQLRIKAGLDGSAQNVAVDVAQFAMSGQHIAWINSSGAVFAQFELGGDVYELLSSGATQVDIEEVEPRSSVRIGILLEDGSVATMDGSALVNLWTWSNNWEEHVSSGTQEILLEGIGVGMLGSDGRLGVRRNTGSSWGGILYTRPYSGEISQFDLQVNVPSPPARTTPADYEQGRIACHNNQPYACQTPPDDSGATRVPLYGRFCGAGIPTDENWNAFEHTAIDSFDAACHHHDHQLGWYPEAVRLGSCIVRFSIENARLTKDGVVLEEDTAEWTAVWAKMQDMHDAIYLYDWYTLGCIPSELAEFTEATR